MNLLFIELEITNINPVTNWYTGHNCYLITSKKSFISMDEKTLLSYKETIAIDSFNSENDDLIFYYAERLKKISILTMSLA